AAWLTAHLGWRGSLQAVGALVVLLAFPLAYFVKEAPTEPARGEPVEPRSDTRGQPGIGVVLSTPAFYLLAVGSMCSIAAVGGTNQHLKLFLSLDLKFSQEAAASITSTVLFCS